MTRAAETAASTAPCGPRPILFLEPVGERGGAEVVMLDLLRHLDRSRFVPHVALLADGPLAGEVAPLAAGVHVFRAHRVREIATTVRTVLGLARLVKRHGIELIHTQGTKTHLYGGLVRLITGVPELWHVYDPPPGRPSMIDRAVTRLPADRLLFISDGPRRAFAAMMDTSRAAVVHPGIRPLPGPDPGPAERLLGSLGVPPGAPVVLQVSRLQRFKGHAHLIRAASRLRERHPDARVVMVGSSLFGLEPGYRDELERLIRQERLESAVHLVGWQSDETVSSLLARASCLCYAEERGPYSLVILEAMAAGRPVVATRTEGSELLVEAGRTGELVAPAEPAGLASALISLLDDPERARRLGEAGRERQQRLFSATSMASAIGRIHEEMLEARGGRA